MIKFFRKIRQNLLSEGKTGKYFKYAIGEIILVVIGILIALQINTWNQNLKDDKLSKDYLIRLQEDFTKDKELLTTRIEEVNWVVHHGTRALSYAENKNGMDSDYWALIIDFYQASQMQNYYVDDFTLEEIKSTGKLELIKNLELRKEIGEHYKWTNWCIKEFWDTNPEYRIKIRGIIPTNVQSYLNGSGQGGGQLQAKEYPSILNSVEESQIIEKIVNRNELIEDLRYWVNDRKNLLLLSEWQRKSNESILEKIENELNK
jgi:hypothetical protein